MIFNDFHGICRFLRAKGLETHGPSETGATCLTAWYSLIQLAVASAATTHRTEVTHGAIAWPKNCKQNWLRKIWDQSPKCIRTWVESGFLSLSWREWGRLAELPAQVDFLLTVSARPLSTVQRCSKHGLHSDMLSPEMRDGKSLAQAAYGSIEKTMLHFSCHFNCHFNVVRKR